MSGGPLFGGAADKPARPKAPSVAPGVIHALLASYVAAFQKRFGEPPVIYKKDAPLLAQLVRQHGPAKVEARFRAYLAWDDPFIVESGYSIDGFYRQWNRLAVRESRQAPATSQNPSKTRAYLDDLRSRKGSHA